MGKRKLLVEFFTGQHMSMHMEYGLPRINPGVEDQPEGAMEFLIGDDLRNLSHVGKLLRIGRRKLGHVRIMLARHHKHVDFGLGLMSLNA